MSDQTSNLPVTGQLIACSDHPWLASLAVEEPWNITTSLELHIQNMIKLLPSSDYSINNDQAIHRSAEIEPIAQLKGPMIIGPDCFVANGSLLRGGIVLDRGCIAGHCCELKTTILLSGSKVAHLSFVGDSILGHRVNVEAGAMLANYRNEWTNKTIRIRWRGREVETNVDKFGSILGDDSRVGANASVAPGSVFEQGSIVRRGQIVDQIIGV